MNDRELMLAIVAVMVERMGIHADLPDDVMNRACAEATQIVANATADPPDAGAAGIVLDATARLSAVVKQLSALRRDTTWH